MKEKERKYFFSSSVFCLEKSTKHESAWIHVPS